MIPKWQQNLILATVIALGLMVAALWVETPRLPLPIDEQIQQPKIEQPSTGTLEESPSLSAERDTAKYTLWLARLTGLLVVVGAGQAGLFFWQLRLIRNQMADTEKAANAAVDAANAAKDAAKTTVKLERPYVFVFGANLRFAKSDDIGGNEPGALYTVANYGKTPAIIDEVWAGYYNDRDLVANFEPVPADHILRTHPILAPHEERTEILKSVRPGLPKGNTVVKGDAKALLPEIPAYNQLVLKVVIRYHGAFTTEHETAAYYRLDTASQTLVQWGGTDENYTR